MTDAEKAWVAGFLEGEGWFAFQGSRGPRPSKRMRVGVAQVNKEPLERLQGFYGGKLSYRHRLANNDGHARRNWWGWEITDTAAILRLTEDIRPWLSQNRLDRIPWVGTVQPALLEVEDVAVT